MQIKHWTREPITWVGLLSSAFLTSPSCPRILCFHTSTIHTLNCTVRYSVEKKEWKGLLLLYLSSFSLPKHHPIEKRGWNKILEHRESPAKKRQKQEQHPELQKPTDLQEVGHGVDEGNLLCFKLQHWQYQWLSGYVFVCLSLLRQCLLFLSLFRPHAINPENYMKSAKCFISKLHQSVIGGQISDTDTTTTVTSLQTFSCMEGTHQKSRLKYTMYCNTSNKWETLTPVAILTASTCCSEV